MGKRKIQLKAPVNRGFATVSVPKKESVKKDEPAKEPPKAAKDEQAGAEPRDTQQDPVAATSAAKDGDLSPADRELQELAEKVLPASERHCSRRGKVIEMNQRLAPTLPVLPFERSLNDKILSAAFREEYIENAPRKLPMDKAPPADAPISVALAAGSDIDDLLVRALSMRTLLKQVGFSDEHIDMAIRYAPTLEFEEAIAWLVSVLPARQTANVAPVGSQTEAADEYPVPVPHPAYTFERRAANAKAVPKEEPAPKETSVESVSAETRAELVKSATRTLAQAKDILAAEASWDASLERPVAAWAAARAVSSLIDQENVRRRKAVGRMDAQLAAALDNKAYEERAQALQSQAAAVAAQCEAQHAFIRGDAAKLFSERMRAAVESSRAQAVADAQEEVRRARRREQIEQLHKKATGEEASGEEASGDSAEAVPAADAGNSGSPGENTGIPDAHDCPKNDDVESLADMFAEKVDTEETTSVRMRDLASGPGSNRSAKTILGDALRHIDMHARVRFTPLGSGRVKRSQLELRWSSRRSVGEPTIDVYKLTGEGCETAQLADDLVATIALHAIERDRPVQRMLGAGFRDFWDELDAARRKQQEADARKNVEHMQALLRERSGGVSLPKSVEERALQPPRVRGGGENADLPDFAAISSSASYLNMLPGRQSLPIAAYRQHILDTINSNQVTVLSGETGCGKSTQLPAYILEDCLARGERCRIYVTEPRRISAISLAQRVSQELGEAPRAVGTDGSLVGYAIRLESHVSRTTRLVYATTGIVLRMLESDAFNDITHIVVDEVHERSIESDFLLIILKTMMAQRPSLKIVLMSATLDAERISEYFGGCPTLAVPGRTFPVAVNFLEDVLELTGYLLDDGSPYARRRLTDKNVQLEDEDEEEDEEEPSVVLPRYSPQTVDTLTRLNEHVVNHEIIITLLEKLCLGGALRDDGAILVFLPGMADIRRIYDALLAHRYFGCASFLIYALHSSVASEGQNAVFDLPPPGVRKIVLSTNIAETGITIPDITCVIDSGKHREMRYDEKRKISRLVECFVARSNAKQRRGRAGRVQEGVCYHLFTRARHDNMLEDHPVPEMLRLSLQELALKLKVMRIRVGDTIEDALARALDPPLPVNIQRAVNSLIEVDALTPNQEITPLGRHLCHMPLDVHLGKFLLISVLFRCVDAALTIAAVLSSKSPFVAPMGQERRAQAAKAALMQAGSDFCTYAFVFAMWRKHVRGNAGKRYCTVNSLSADVLYQIEELRQQYLAYLLDSGFMRDDGVRQELARSRKGARPRLVDVPAAYNTHSEDYAAVTLALTAALYPKALAYDGSQLRTLTNNQPTFVHPSSAIRGVQLGRRGTHVLYYTIMMSKRLYAWEAAVVDTRALLLVCGDVEFRHSSSTLTLDKTRGRFALREPASLVSLRVLRDQLTRAINDFYL
ncbi:RNA helicase [Malassezia cuniculi]|uniref:RNA helicase n=1 Tax=Malassezia cuniculi TaxID=948313 RepID=A0AAF0EVA2_9BASI|nr:RNA helicase [Malassezia cuniculi]